MDHDLLVENIISTVKLAKLFGVPVVHSTVNVASGRQGPTIPRVGELLEDDPPSTERRSTRGRTSISLPGQWFSTYGEPAGVVAIIVPWNATVALFIRSLAPALSAGNTVV